MITEVLPMSKRTNKQLYSFEDLKQYILTKLIEQGRRSADTYGDCKYRMIDENNNILKCAVGHVIPDELYNPNMEDETLGNLLRLYTNSLLIEEMPELEIYKQELKDLQHIHDNWIKPFNQDLIRKFERMVPK